MRQASSKRSRATNSVTPAIAGSAARRLASTIVLLAGSMLLTAAIGAYHRRPSASAVLTSPAIASPLGQSSGKSGRDLHSRLSLQPEADKFRRRVGQRFTEPGREHASLVGTLTIGAQQFQVRIDRSQEDDGEQVQVSLSGGGGSLTWNGKDGARSAGRDAAGAERSLIEKIALDSPDQFILAQLRGASYFLAARQAIPPGAVPGDDYDGPVWDVVRVAEPSFSPRPNQPVSLGRLYHINCVTGLIDKVVSQEQGEIIEAYLTNWADAGGELTPTRVKWMRDGQILMELIVTSASNGPKQ